MRLHRPVFALLFFGVACGGAVWTACSSSNDASLATGAPGIDGSSSAITDGGAGATIFDDAGDSITTLGSTSQMVDGSGATVTLGMASLVIPPGALSTATSIGITAKSILRDGGAPVTVYVFSPEGLTFATPATVSLPGAAGTIRWSEIVNGGLFFTQLPTTFANGVGTASVTHFSTGMLADELGDGAVDGCEQVISYNGNVVQTYICPPGYSTGQPPMFDIGFNVGWCEGLFTAGFNDIDGSTVLVTINNYAGPPYLCYPDKDAAAPDAGVAPDASADASTDASVTTCQVGGGAANGGAASCEPACGGSCTGSGSNMFSSGSTCNGVVYGIACSETCTATYTCTMCNTPPPPGTPMCTSVSGGTPVCPATQSCTCTTNGTQTGTTTYDNGDTSGQALADAWAGCHFPGTFSF